MEPYRETVCHTVSFVCTQTHKSKVDMCSHVRPLTLKVHWVDIIHPGGGGVFQEGGSVTNQFSLPGGSGNPANKRA